MKPSSLALTSGLLLGQTFTLLAGEVCTNRFSAASADAAVRWQRQAREKLFELTMGGRKPERMPLDARTVQCDESPD